MLYSLLHDLLSNKSTGDQSSAVWVTVVFICIFFVCPSVGLSCFTVFYFLGHFDIML